MSTALSAQRSRQALTDHAERLGRHAATANRETPVPTCPRWSMDDLIEHVGQTLHWVSEIIERRITDPTQLPSTELAELPAEPENWPTWLSEAAARASAACSDKALEAPVFNASGDTRTGGQFWLTSMLNETVVHGFDAANAVGERSAIDADVAAALIANHLAMLTSPTWAFQRPESATAIRGTGETLLWRATDGTGSGTTSEWLVERRPEGVRWQEHHDSGAADVTVEGPASALLLVLTRRLPLSDGDSDRVSVDGEVAVARHWVENTAHDAG